MHWILHAIFGRQNAVEVGGFAAEAEASGGGGEASPPSHAEDFSRELCIEFGLRI